MKTRIIEIIATVVAFVAGGLLLACHAQKPADNIVRLKQKFESCKMLEVGQEYNCIIQVPDFLQQQPTDELYTQRYIYDDEASGMRFGVSSYVTDAEGLDAETAAKEFTQGTTPLFTEIGADYYIIEGFIEGSNVYVDLEKTFFVGEYCLSLHFFYPKAYSWAAQRYIDVVKAWDPFPEE